MKIRRDIFSFRNRVVVIIVGIALGMVSLLFTNNIDLPLSINNGQLIIDNGQQTIDK